MRSIFMFVLVALSTSGCAVMHRGVDGAVEISYAGPSARAAAELVGVTDSRPYDMAETAMDRGMVTSLRRGSDGSVGFSAGYGYGGYGYVGGNTNYAAPDIVSVPGGWYAPTGAGSSLPVLGQTVVSGIPADSGTSRIVPCPTDRPVANVAEQAACTSVDFRALLESLEE
jgi:hypothetical protein